MISKLSATRLAARLLLAWSCLMLFGCGSYSATEHRVEAGTAKKVLEEVLASWKDGGSIDDWQKRKPQVVVQDMDWKSGAALQSFEINGEGEAIDANLHCQVKLKLLLPNKTKSEKTVTYLVGTSPVTTVFRALGP